MSMRPCAVRCLLIEFDAAGRADALEISFLFSSDDIAADFELGQRPRILDGISDSSRTYSYQQ
jgi:hypothetical protein